MALVCIGAVAWMVTNLGSNLNYMESVSTAVHQRDANHTSPNRVGGVVKPHTIKKGATFGAIFQMTDGRTTVTARVQGTPPDLFADCIPVILNNTHWEGSTLVGDQVTVKHGSTYTSKQMKSNVDTALDATGCAPAAKG